MATKKEILATTLADMISEYMCGTTAHCPVTLTAEKILVVSVSALAERSGMYPPTARKTFARYLADRSKPAAAGMGTPIDWFVLEDLLEPTGFDATDVFRALEKTAQDTASKRTGSDIAPMAEAVLLEQAKRLVAGEPSAFALEDGQIRIVIGEALDGLERPSPVQFGTGVRQLGLWEGRPEYAAKVQRIGRALGAAKLCTWLQGQGVDVQAFLEALGARKGARSVGARGPGRPPKRKRTDPPDPEFAVWVRTETAAGRLDPVELMGDDGYKTTLARFHDTRK